MLLKLALSGAKSRLKDYVVLFSGLTISSAIFYMFLSLALNNKFLSTGSMMNSGNTTFVFGFGIVLLAIITFVYVIYANSFLLSMRQRDYGMFLMLGAKTGRIGILIFLETMLMGTIATLLGTILGVGLTQVTAGLLVSQLHLVLTGFVGFYFPAMLATLLFFVVLFFLAAIYNRRKLVRTPVLELLYGNKKPVRYSKNPIWIAIQAVLGVVLLGIGYLAMVNVQTLILASVPIALVTIVLGSYFVFNSLFIAIINLIRARHKVLYKGLRSFTLNQLRFRIKDYTRILSVISILFALALGAITVGLGFENMTSQISDTQYYDAQIVHETAATKKALAKVDVKTKVTYSYKKTSDKVYLNESEFANKPLKYKEALPAKFGTLKTKTATLSVKQLKDPEGQAPYLLRGIIPVDDSKQIDFVFLTAEKFAARSEQKQQVTLITVANFKEQADKLLDLQQTQLAADKNLTDYVSETKAMQFQLVRSVTSGFEFMGFFLGIAFLTMLASTLMFKILSGAQSDVARYEMLSKIGVKTRLLKRSIAQEIGVLFALPGLLGIIHVLFGLQFFKAFLPDPYDGIWLPFTIFIALYLVYYFITTWLYRGIVLKKTV